MYAALTGAHLGAAEALHLGLADTAIDSADLEDLIEALSNAGVDEVLPRYQIDVGASLFATERDGARIEKVFSVSSLTAVTEALKELADGAEEDPDAVWAREMLETLRAKSPSSLALTFELLRRAVGGTLKESLQREFLVGMRRCQHPDFAEGVRAQVIDKDRAPAWNPATLAEVDPAWVQRQFDPDARYRLFD